MAPTPHPRVQFTLVARKSAINSSDTLIRLTGATKLTLADGATVSIPAGTEVMLATRTQFEVPSGIDVTLVRRRMRPTRDLYSEFFDSMYSPNHGLTQQPYPVKDLDFSSSGAYSVYNWELFFHVPLTIAIHLSKNQRFAEAQKWFHYLFDPTDDSDGPTPERFWKVRPFQYTDVKKIEEVLVNLVTGADEDLRRETVHSIEAWKDAPFRPHIIAPSLPAGDRTTADCSRPTCAMIVTCRSRDQAPSANGSWKCPPIYASSIMTPSLTSSFTSVTLRAKAAACYETARSPTSKNGLPRPRRPGRCGYSPCAMSFRQSGQSSRASRCDRGLKQA